MDDILILEEPYLLMEEPIEFDNEKLLFYQGQYQDGTTAIFCNTKSGDRYDMISIDVSDHVKHGLKYNEIVLNHKLPHELKELFYNIFSCDYENDYYDCREVQYGFSCSNIIQIKPSFLVKTYDGIIEEI